MSDSLQQIIDEPRPSEHALDDPADLENAAILSWARHHAAFTLHSGTYAIGRAHLPPGWQTEQFGSPQAASRLLRQLKSSHKSMTSLRTALAGVAVTPPAENDAMIDLAAAMLSDQRLWLLRVPRHMPSQAGKTDPSVYVKVNGANGTNVDFAYLSRWEGGQMLRGYVPFVGGVVAGKSGLTIATGFDVGQKTADALDDL